MFRIKDYKITIINMNHLSPPSIYKVKLETKDVFYTMPLLLFYSYPKENYKLIQMTIDDNVMQPLYNTNITELYI